MAVSLSLPPAHTVCISSPCPPIAMIGFKRPSNVVVALHLIASLSDTVTAMRLESLERRAAQTNAVCSTEYAWADNGKHNSPCLVAAQALAPCNGGSWTVPALTAPNQAYTNPGVTPPTNSTPSPANPCSCSWTVYNLLSACSDCQGLPQAVRVWADYSHLCGSNLDTTKYYPEGYLPNDVTIPVWATTDPTTWNDRTYNAIQAKQTAQQNLPDVQGNPPVVEKKKSSAGPIAGGVVGGVVALAIAAGIAYYMLRRHREAARGTASVYTEKTHNRGPSDATMTSLGYTSMSSPSPGPGPSHIAPTIHTHATSIHSFSAFGSPQRNTNYTASPSPPPHTQIASSSNPEDVVIPFTLQHQRGDSGQSMDRKSPNGPARPIYDSPNAPPSRAADALFTTPERPRVNPPAYSPHDTPTPSGSSQPARPPHHRGDSDADLSYASYSNHGHGLQASIADNSASDIFTTGPGDAFSAVGGTTLTRSGSAAQTTYTSPASYPRDVKRRPTEDDSNPTM